MRLIFLSLFLLSSFLVQAQSGQGKADTTTQKIYAYAEQMPEPRYDLNKYLSDHLNYPDSAYNANVQGRVIVRFVVNEDGSISDSKVVKGIGAGCDEAAVKVLANMPAWKAGIQDGKKVRVYITLPISFILDKKNRR